MRVRSLCVGLAVVLLLVHAPYEGDLTADSPVWVVENAGTLGGDSVARAINISGSVAGYSAIADGSLRGFVAAPGFGPQAIPTLGGDTGQALGLNDDGTAAGFSATADGYFHAFRADPGALPVDLGTLGGQNSYAYGVNAAGTVVGYSATADGSFHAFRYSDATGLEDLGTLGGPASFAFDVNDKGAIAGQSFRADFRAHAFLLENGVMADLGTLGGAVSNATALNEAGVVVGSAAVATGAWHAFRKPHGGAMQDLGTLGGTSSGAEGVNAAGDVVGWSDTSAGERHAFLWTADNGLVDLNSLVDPAEGWTLVRAYAINDAGQIAGEGVLDGQVRAFRLSPPVTSDVTPPVITAVSASPSLIDASNHRLVPVAVSVSASDESGEAPACAVSSVTSNEPDNGLGDGDTAGDIVLAGPLAVELRAERSAQGSGRVYTIEVTCTDGAANTASSSTTVRVPKSNSSNSAEPSVKKPKPFARPGSQG